MTAPDYAQAFMAERPLEPARAALLIVDMQYASAHRDGPLAARMAAEGQGTTDWRFGRIHGSVIPNLQRLSTAMRAAGGRIVYVTIGAGLPDYSDAAPHMRAFLEGLGNHAGAEAHRIVAELAPEPGDPVIRKTTMGAFASTGIDATLRGLGVEYLVVGGVSTNMCVDTTAREAADRGYAVTLVEDACAATHEDLHLAALRSFARFFGQVRGTDEVVARLSRA